MITLFGCVPKKWLVFSEPVASAWEHTLGADAFSSDCADAPNLGRTPLFDRKGEAENAVTVEAGAGDEGNGFVLRAVIDGYLTKAL